MDTRISEKELRAFMERAYEKEGFEQEEARRIADVLMQADLFGIESHGAQRMMYYHQNIKSGSVDVHARAEIVRETPVSALLDGHFAMGHLTAAKAVSYTHLDVYKRQPWRHACRIRAFGACTSWKRWR